MKYPADFKFRPTDDVIIDYYLLLKHLGIEEGDVNDFITTAKIFGFDPWDLLSKSKSKWNDNLVWYFYSRDEYKFSEGVWKTNSGYWKKIGSNNTPIFGKWKRSNGVKIGEKNVLVFHAYEDPNESKPDWVMHVYQPTFLPPEQRTYVVCKVQFKSGDKDISSGSSDNEYELNHSSISNINFFGASSTTRSEVG